MTYTFGYLHCRLPLVCLCFCNFLVFHLIAAAVFFPYTSSINPPMGSRYNVSQQSAVFEATTKQIDDILDLPSSLPCLVSNRKQRYAEGKYIRTGEKEGINRGLISRREGFLDRISAGNLLKRFYQQLLSSKRLASRCFVRVVRALARQVGLQRGVRTICCEQNSCICKSKSYSPSGCCFSRVLGGLPSLLRFQTLGRGPRYWFVCENLPFFKDFTFSLRYAGNSKLCQPQSDRSRLNASNSPLSRGLRRFQVKQREQSLFTVNATFLLPVSNVSPKEEPVCYSLPTLESLNKDGASGFLPLPIRLYVDGSCVRNSDAVAAACGIYFESPSYAHLNQGILLPLDIRTNQAAELAALRAVLLILRSAPASPLCIYTDSWYVVRGVTDWMPNRWKLNGWLTSSGEKVSNMQLFKDIDELIAERTGGISIEWVRGHSGNSGNEGAHKLAKSAIMHNYESR